jgi:hypothetical protein
MGRSTLSFGIEVEMLVATLAPWHPHPNPAETRTVLFPREPNAQTLNVPALATHEDVMHHVSQTLLAAGLHVSTPEFLTYDPDPDFTAWSVDRDPSVGPLLVEKMRNGYQSVGVEVRSPAYFYSANSLQEVGYAMGVLTSTYVLSVNHTTGLHVHVGNGMESFQFDTMRRLVAFLWAFEPQISTLHPPQRFNHGWAGSLRYCSAYSRSYSDAYSRLPRPLEGVAHFLKSNNWKDLLADCGSGNGRIPRLAYRFADLAQFDENRRLPTHKLTVEFRQRAGSVDGEEIKNWVRTTVGFIIDSDPRALKDLFSIIAAETFDGENGETIEPVLAETEFTIIDLLRHMNLNIPAAYYQQRGLYKIRIGVDGEVVNRNSFPRPGYIFGVGRGSQEQRRLRDETEAQNRAFHCAPTMRDSSSIRPGTPWIQNLSSAPSAGPADGNDEEQQETREEREALKRLRSSNWRRSQPMTSNPRNTPSFSKDEFARHHGQGEASTAQASTTSSFLTDDMQDVSELLTNEVVKNDDEHYTRTLAARRLEGTAKEQSEE